MYVTWGFLNQGVSVEQGVEELQRLGARIREENPNDGPEWTFELLSGVEANRSGTRAVVAKTTLLLFALISLLLLIALSNVTNLVSARVKSRLHEYSVFLAIGANRNWVLRRLFFENVLLSFLGWGLGVAIALGLLKAFRSGIPGTGEVNEVSLLGNAWVVSALLVVPVLCGLFISVGGWLDVLRIDLNRELRMGTRGTKQFFGRKVFVGFQVALSVVIVSVCGWFIESLRNAHNIDHGFESDELLLLAVNYKPMGRQYDDPRYTIPEYRRIKSRLEELPQVATVGMGTLQPLRHNKKTKIEIDGYDFRVEADQCQVRSHYVGPDYFKTLGVELLQGRGMRFEDMNYPMSKVIVNEAFVDRYWPGGVAIGRSFKPWRDGPVVDVVGVCADFEQELGLDTLPQIFVGFAPPDMVFHIKTEGNPELVRKEIAGMLGDGSLKLPVLELTTIEESFGETFSVFKLSALVAGYVALLALAIAGYGLFALMYHLVKDHRNEIGIRMAIGADGRRILSWTMRECGVPVVWGVALGLGAVLVLFGKFSELLFAVERFDPAPLVTVVVVLATVALISMIGPALRAARRDPVENLRDA